MMNLLACGSGWRCTGNEAVDQRRRTTMAACLAGAKGQKQGLGQDQNWRLRACSSSRSRRGGGSSSRGILCGSGGSCSCAAVTCATVTISLRLDSLGLSPVGTCCDFPTLGFRQGSRRAQC